MARRGQYQFETDERGNLTDTPDNLERTRRLFRDGTIIDGRFGPGNRGDFDHGSWHILCHLAGASGVMVAANGRGHRWLGITHDAARDRYQATVSRDMGSGRIQTLPCTDPAGRRLLDEAQVVGFIEGASVGHIAARGVIDPPEAFNNWPRQMFDRSPQDPEDGGTVWEQWCINRDIRPTSAVGDSGLRAYLTLVSVLGGRFVAAVARGRREHEHPRHLAALVKAGFLSREEALWDLAPRPIPDGIESRLLEARPPDSLAAASLLPWEAGTPRYYMFKRRIDRWSRRADVLDDLGRFGVQ